MASNTACKYEEAETASRAGQPASTGPSLPPEGSSTVAAMQHRLQQAALQGFFDKPSSGRRWRARHRAPLTLAIAVGSWMTVFTIIWELVG